MKLTLSPKHLIAATIALTVTMGAQAQLWFNTGIVETSPGSSLDAKYLYRGTASGFGGALGPVLGNTAIAHETLFPFGTGQWTPNTAASKWLQPGITSADGLATANSQNSFFVFETSFNFDPTVWSLGSSSFGIRATADNQLQIFDSGVAIAPPGDVDTFVIDIVDNFTLNAASGLHAGLNTIDIYVHNLDGIALNPSGFRLEVSNNLVPVSISSIPEPSTYGLLGAIALAGLMAFRRISSKSEALDL